MKQRRNLKKIHFITVIGKHHTEPSEQSPSPLPHNIFNSKSQLHLNMFKANSKKAYDIVGIKQLRAFQQKLKRVSKVNRRDTIPLSLANNGCLFEQKQNVLRNPQDNCLSKEKILQKFDNHFTSNNKRTYLYKKEKQTSPQNLNTTLNSSISNNNILNSSFIRDLCDQSYASIQKIKYRFNAYKNDWKTLQNKREQTKGQKSIIRITDSERQKYHRKVQDQRLFLQDNINSRLWSDNLRTSKPFKHVYNRNVLMTYDKGEKWILVKGRDKLVKERQWMLNEDIDLKYKFLQSS